jgi:uncharacterized membrane protein YhhN
VCGVYVRVCVCVVCGVFLLTHLVFVGLYCPIAPVNAHSRKTHAVLFGIKGPLNREAP